MRVIAGEYKGRRLQTPADYSVRPTTDKVKEALFSILADRIWGSRVLDLSSGTGNLGIEALSRGAELCVFGDNSRESIRMIKDNIAHCRAEGAVVKAGDYKKLLMNLDGQFDIIILDPPYDTRYGLNTLKFIDENLGKILEDNGIIVYETDKNFVQKMQKSDINSFSNFDNLDCVDERSYSNVVLKMYKWR